MLGFDCSAASDMDSFSGAYYGIYDPVQILQKLLTGEVNQSTAVGTIADKGYKWVNCKFLAHVS